MYFVRTALLGALFFFAVLLHAAAPTLSTSSPPSGRVGYDYYYRVSATGSVSSFDAVNLPPGLTIGHTDGAIGGRPTQAGTFDFTVSATNSDGTGTANFSILINPAPTDPPVISAPATYSSHYILYTYPASTWLTVHASNYPQTFTATGAPSGASYFDRGTGNLELDNNDYATPGIWTVTFTATNAAGSATAQTVWSVAPAVLGRSLSSSLYHAGDVITVRVGFNSAVNVTGQPRVGLGGFWADRQPHYATYASGSGTSELVFTYQTTATDFQPTDGNLGGVDLNGGTVKHASGLDAYLEYPRQVIGETLPSFRVVAPPVITSAATAAGTVGVGFQFPITATNQASQLTATGLPPGLSLDGFTGVISGTPTLSGTFAVAVTAKNFYVDTAGSQTLTLTIVDSPTGRPTITQLPPSRVADVGSSVTFATGTTAPNPTFQWQWNGKLLVGATQPSLTLTNVGSGDAGVYTATITDSGQSSMTPPAILGIASTVKVIGSGAEVGPDIVHANGNVYDQVLLQGPAATVTADAGQVVRISYLDLNDDIVQVEFSGRGTLSIVLDSASGPMTAQNYNQPAVSYMKGHAGIVIAGADASTNVSVFSVGRVTAVNQALFRSDVTYDGVADIAFLAIQSPSGNFGGVRLANTSFWSTRGVTGIYAPSVNFSGPVYLCDIIASEEAVPTLVLGRAYDVRVAGGDLNQTNGRAVQVKGFTRLTFGDGTTSNGDRLPALANRGRLEEDGRDVTSSVVVNPPAP